MNLERMLDQLAIETYAAASVPYVQHTPLLDAMLHPMPILDAIIEAETAVQQGPMQLVCSCGRMASECWLLTMSIHIPVGTDPYEHVRNL